MFSTEPKVCNEVEIIEYSLNLSLEIDKTDLTKKIELPIKTGIF